MNARMAISATTNIWMSSQNPETTIGQASTNTSPLNNWLRKAGQASELTTTTAKTPKNTSVETKAMSAALAGAAIFAVVRSSPRGQ
mgnify:CR=1 FL=1